MKIELLAAGWCRHPECVVMRGGSWRPLEMPAGVALIEHPRLGIGLFDAGYSQRFIEATRPFPQRLYRWVTPPSLPAGSTAAAQLSARGISPSQVRWIVLSHLHADHVAGVLDFPAARLFVHGAALRAMRRRDCWENLLHGVLPALLPDDLDARTTVLEAGDFALVGPGDLPAHDLAGDGTLLIIPLPGHAAGQIGLQIAPRDAQPLFLIADAAWSSRALASDGHGPSRLADLICESSRTATLTLNRLRRLRAAAPELRMVPSHCPACWPRR